LKQKQKASEWQASRFSLAKLAKVRTSVRKIRGNCQPLNQKSYKIKETSILATSEKSQKLQRNPIKISKTKAPIFSSP
jgi:hypothetical protein